MSEYFYLERGSLNHPLFRDEVMTFRGAFLALASLGRITRATVCGLSGLWGVHERTAARFVDRMEKSGLVSTHGFGKCKLICIEADFIRTCGFHVLSDAQWPEGHGGSKWRGTGLSAKVRRQVLDRDNNVCAYCGVSGVPMHVDHIHPVSRGGTDDIKNLTAACAPCNSSKGAKTLKEWGGNNG